MRTITALFLGFLAGRELARRSVKPVEMETNPHGVTWRCGPMTEAIVDYQQEAACRAARQ